MNWNPTNWLAACLVSLSSSPSPIDHTKPAVVLIHGIFDSGSKMAWLAARFSKAGYEVFCPSLLPCAGSCSLEELSHQLDKKIHSRFSKDRCLHIVGFSMGGLIARHWLIHSADHARIVSFSTLGTPHRGTLTAYFLRGTGVKEMRPGSAFLSRLVAEEEQLRSLAALSLYTPLDLIVIPAFNSKWDLATTEKVWLPIHPLLVFSPKVVRRLFTQFEERERVFVTP